jgi:hypothetical protein
VLAHGALERAGAVPVQHEAGRLADTQHAVEEDIDLLERLVHA